MSSSSAETSPSGCSIDWDETMALLLLGDGRLLWDKDRALFTAGGTYKMAFVKTGMLEGEDCAICLERFNVDDAVLRIKCSHIFHADCLILWFVRKLACPMCRFRCSRWVRWKQQNE